MIVIYILMFILGFVSCGVLYKFIQQIKNEKEIKVEKVICEDCFDCTLLLFPTIIPKNKNIVVRHNLSFHTLDNKSIGNPPKPKGKDLLFEKYCPENESSDKTLIIASPITIVIGKVHIDRGVKLIFRRQCNYYLGEVAKEIDLGEWTVRNEGTSIKIPVIIAGQQRNIKLSSIVAQVREIFADWHYE